jgi:hypothetical protein
MSLHSIARWHECARTSVGRMILVQIDGRAEMFRIDMDSLSI